MFNRTRSRSSRKVSLNVQSRAVISQPEPDLLIARLFRSDRPSKRGFLSDSDVFYNVSKKKNPADGSSDTSLAGYWKRDIKNIEQGGSNHQPVKFCIRPGRLKKTIDQLFTLVRWWWPNIELSFEDFPVRLFIRVRLILLQFLTWLPFRFYFYYNGYL